MKAAETVGQQQPGTVGELRTARQEGLHHQLTEDLVSQPLIGHAHLHDVVTKQRLLLTVQLWVVYEL